MTPDWRRRDNMIMRTTRLHLSTLDGQLIDGLEFCRMVYDLFDETRRAPNGLRVLRLRSTTTAKKLLEELIPIARFIQARYQYGRRIKVRWFSGSQPYDAILWSSGALVKHGMARRRQVLEVTTAVHPNDHLSREESDTKGMSWGAKQVRRDRRTREITSDPYVYSGNERSLDLSGQILQCVKKKAVKNYPASTILIVNCESEGLMLEDEWDEVVGQVKHAQEMPFREVFLVETGRAWTATIYGRPEARRRTRRARAA
jgi:hypothetical protein